MPNLSYLAPHVAVKTSPIHGQGLFAVAAIRQGEIVAIKGGYIFSRDTLQEVEQRLGAADIPIAEGFFIGPLRQEERQGGMIFSNHSCSPNIGMQGQIVFVALRDIQPGEELTHDWAMTDDDTYEMVCNCGASNCRGIVTGQDWRKPELQEKYGTFMSWYILEKIRRAAP